MPDNADKVNNGSLGRNKDKGCTIHKNGNRKIPHFSSLCSRQRTKLLEKNMKIYLDTQAFKMMRVS